MKKLIIGSLVAVGLGSVALPAAARTNIDFFVNIGPPPVYHEYVPAHRPGFVWVPGVWEWRRGHYHWVGGHWVRHRPGYVYAPPYWYERDGRHHYRRGAWRHGDADHDGVPNRFDRRPYNPRWY